MNADPITTIFLFVMMFSFMVLGMIEIENQLVSRKLVLWRFVGAVVFILLALLIAYGLDIQRANFPIGVFEK